MKKNIKQKLYRKRWLIKINHWIEDIWYPLPHPKFNIIKILILPWLWLLSKIYWLLAWIKKSTSSYQKIPTSTIVVGNITVGGSGKTPFIIALAKELINRNIKIAIVAHGFLGSVTKPTEVPLNGDYQSYGDEALLIKKQLESFANIPIYIGKPRAKVAQQMLTDYPDLEIIIFDDGIQDPSFFRDLEILLFSKSGVGNQQLIPAGPLREPIYNLSIANNYAQARKAVTTDISDNNYPSIEKKIIGGVFLNDFVQNNYLKKIKPLDNFRDLCWLYFAAFARPWRLLSTIKEYTNRYYHFFYPDHYPIDFIEINYQLAKLNQELVQRSIIIITEKDAIKLANDEDFQSLCKIPIPIVVICYQLSISSNFVNQILDTIYEFQPHQS